MAKLIMYTVKRGRKWLQGIEANLNYKRGACAPTMGASHTYAEYKTVWGDNPKSFEPLTLASYIKILCEEYRWETKKPLEIKIIPDRKDGE